MAPIGINYRSGRIAPDTASVLVAATVRFLQQMEAADTILREYADWWEHDGLHFDRRNITFGELANLVATAEAIKAAMCGDFRVFVGVAPRNFRCYLRFYHENWLDTEGELRASFDFTLPGEWIRPYREIVVAPLAAELTEKDSLSYYQSIGMDSYPH